MDERHIRGLLIAFVGAIVAVNIIATGTSSSLFCATCHSHQAAALEESTHNAIRCNTCHQRNDFLDIFAWRAKVLGMVVRQATFSYRRPVIANVSRNSCIRCHENVLIEVTRRNAIRVSHKEINDASHKCTNCHNTVAHPGAVTNPKFPTMDKCATCHNSQRVDASCEVCHMQEVDERRRVKTSWSMTHGPQWKRLHGMGDLNNCRVCHGANYCLKCHNTVLPHPDFWIRLHSRDAKAKIEGCYQCHHKNYCMNCHGIEMPHSSNFIKRHASDVKKKGDKSCKRCHLEAGCDRCHARHVHPGFDQERMRELRRGAGLD
ncbi:MAG: NapC/NirT family cytochrome c [Actinobacteria bacterium]|nr:NapC/NirT family cytochrome c [Actinomycetota bacterium]